MKVQFKQWPCVLSFAKYGNGRAAIQLFDEEDGSPVATATVNIPESVLEDGEILIKNWSENEGMLDTLVAAGVVEDTGKTVPSGYVEANVCRLLVEPS